MTRRLIPIHRGHIISDPFNFLRQEIDKLFDNSSSVQGIRPDFEVKENKEGLQLTAELPGVAEKDIDISISNGVLTISGEKKTEESKEGDTFHITERTYGSFSRSLQLPFEPEEKDVSAVFENGILNLNIPRPQGEKKNIHRIPIQKK